MSVAVVLYLLVAVSVHSAAARTGPCGGYACVPVAQCVNNTCTCPNPPYDRGDGRFGCYRPNTVSAEVRNDPTLTTFNGETVNFPYPCRYLLTHFRQDLKNGQTVIGYCEFQIHLFNDRDLGKFYVKGFEAAIKIHYNYGLDKGFSFITWGVSPNIQTNDANSYSPDGPYPLPENPGPVVLTAPNNVKIMRYTDAQGLVVKVDACGTKLTFVPYNKNLRINSPLVPGVSLVVDCGFEPQWRSNDQVMALAPPSGGGQLISGVQASYPGLSRADAMLHRAFTRNVTQNQPDASIKCLAVPHSLGSCSPTQLATVYSKASWLFSKYPPLIRCISAGSTTCSYILKLFQLVVDYVCNDAVVCADVTSIVGNCAGSTPPPELTSLLDLVCP
ncbi:uncharacterized protein LOC131944152 [Physella acuta]|uniref:uncharacterized protein LOC131944152 n=1 Tax=Physella acuta TaxID=109671 RepID=UPI0027DB4F06|nr:uncharacterized protein LOC131944152 [Physella acuta]